MAAGRAPGKVWQGFLGFRILLPPGGGGHIFPIRWVVALAPPLSAPASPTRNCAARSLGGLAVVGFPTRRPGAGGLRRWGTHVFIRQCSAKFSAFQRPLLSSTPSRGGLSDYDRAV